MLPTTTILIADDECSVREVVGLALRRHGYEVLEAADGRQALELAAAHSSRIHLLLTDLRMPVMDGRELAERLKRKHPETKILFMSGYSVAALDPQAAFLPKPFSPGALVSKVEEILEGRQVRSV